MSRLPTPLTALTVALALLGCEGSDTDRLERIQSVAVSDPVLLGGGGLGIFIGFVDQGVSPNAVHFFRFDPTTPDVLLDVGGANLPASPVSDLNVDIYTAVTMAMGVASVFDLQGDTPTLTATYEFDVFLRLAASQGRWLLAAHDKTLRLVDLEAAGGPAQVGAFTSASAVTGLLYVHGQDQFLAFTEQGYVNIIPDVTTPAFTERTHATIRGFHRAFSAGGMEAVVAGPSIYLGKSRVARLDLTTPASPALMKVGDFKGEYGAFAFDGGLGTVPTSILEILGEPGAGLYQGYRIHEGADRFSAVEISLPQWFGSEAHIAARDNRLFALDEAGMTVYRIH